MPIQETHRYDTELNPLICSCCDSNINMKKKYFLLLLFLPAIFNNTGAQKIASFDVELSKPAAGLEIPVNINLNGITFIKDSSLSLIEINGNKKTSVPFQIRQDEQRMLYWIIKPG